MNDLSEHCQRVLRALIAAPIAWLAPTQIAARLGGDRETTYDALADLEAAGWLDPWEMEDDLYITLSTYGAERLRVQLVPGGRSDTMRWASIDDRQPSPRAAGRGQGDVDALDLIPDSSPGPEAEAEAAERAERLVHRSETAGEPPALSTLPRPSILLGSGLTPWPGPGESRGPSCPGCGSRPIPEKAYCLVCDRWGLDPLLDATRASRPRRVARPTPNVPATATDVASARAALKQRQRRKLARKAEGERAERKDQPRPLPDSLRPRRTPSI